MSHPNRSKRPNEEQRYLLVAKTGNQVDYPTIRLGWRLRTRYRRRLALAARGNGAALAGQGAFGEKEDKEPYPASFDAIVELITTGKTDQIPGIKDIPLKINEEPPTQATMNRPLKPWEKADVAAAEAPQTTAQTDTQTQPESMEQS